MLIKTPNFWNEEGWLSNIFQPFSWLYQKFVHFQERKTIPYKACVPVICVGNVVMGGAGKTPTVITIVEMLKKMGHEPHVLSRGYGAIIKDYIKVNPDKHSYLQVGDEPLLLSKIASTWAGSNRVKTAKAAIANGATVLVMDDGLQNYSIEKDFSILVVDAVQGLGNKRIFPAGPLREPIEKALDKSDAIIVVGDDEKAQENIINSLRPYIDKGTLVQTLDSVDVTKHNNIGKTKKDIACFKALLKCEGKVEPKAVVAFAGLGYPDKFRNTLERNGYLVKDFIAFADHHPYTIPEIKKLLKIARQYSTPLITTSKDFLRVPYKYRGKVDVLTVNLNFKNPIEMEQLLLQKIKRRI